MKYKYFLKNLSIFTISNFITKLLMFLMLPLYTSILTSKEYGTIDMITTTVNLAMPILTLCITEAIIRFTIEENTNKKQILLNSLNIAFKGYILLLIASIVAWIIGIEFKILIIFNIYYLVYTVSSLLTYYLKGLERIKIIGWASVIRVITLILLNCLLLLYLKLSVVGYYVSLIVSDIIVIIIYIYNLKKNKVVGNNEKNTTLKKEMIKYSKNFVLNSISWWINNASDKYILLLFYDLDITGIYSVAYKIPTIIEFVQAIYSQAWQISAIKEYNKKTSKNNQFEVLSSTANGIILQNEYFNKQAASLDNTGYKIVPFGFITYRSMSDTGEFHFNIQNITENGIVSPAYPVFEINEDIVDKTYFIYYINENKSFKNKILSLKEGGTRYALSMSKFKEINLDLPPLEYQKKYSKLLNTYNRKIKNEENKLNKLQELKKGLMQNMFV